MGKGLMKQREERRPARQGQKIAREPRERTGPGYLEIPRSLGSSRHATKLGLD